MESERTNWDGLKDLLIGGGGLALYALTLWMVSDYHWLIWIPVAIALGTSWAYAVCKHGGIID